MNNVKHKIVEASIHSLKVWLNSVDPKRLRHFFDSILKETGFSVLNFSENFFPIQGYTAVWMLAESHLAIHTFPQNNCCYVELSSCSGLKTKKFKELLVQSEMDINWETITEILSTPDTPNQN